MAAIDEDCAKCGVHLSTSAEKFLHEKMHGEPFTLSRWAVGLSQIPYVQLAVIAKLMQDYADKQTADLMQEIRERRDEDAMGPIL